MNLLLDTHVFIWLNVSTDKLSEHALALCSAPENSLYLSLASAWEMQIKTQLGKLRLPVGWDDMLARQQQDNGMELLGITLAHIRTELPHHHNDPFDRLLISQSQIEGMPLISVDSKFKHYDVDVLW